ncbi:MAG: hypothetical protein HRT71_21885 [Flavobacteriales bacterium]|nr:hypothetical protein [Flavobacteriales bacterium]
MKKILAYTLLLALGFSLSRCGEAEKSEPAPTYTALNESDYKWRQEVVRVIDVRNEQNKGFAITEGKDKSLIDLIFDAALGDSSLQVYHPIFGKEQPLTIEDLNTRIGSRVDTTWVPSPDPPYELEPIISQEEFSREDVVIYYVTENWYYSDNTNVGEKRISMITAVTEVYDFDGNLKGNKPLFSIDLEEANALLWNANVAGFERNGETVSYLEVFLEELFSSTFKRGHPKVNNKVALFTKEAKEDDPIDMNNVKFVQDVWLSLDLLDPKNEDFAHPLYEDECRTSLARLIIDEVRSNKAVSAYQYLGYGDLNDALTEKEFEDLVGTRIDTIWTPSPEPPYDLVATTATDEWDATFVERFRIKEQWFFNESKEVVGKRIVAICPVQAEYDHEDNLKGYRPLFWVNFEELKPVLAKELLFNSMIFYEEADVNKVNAMVPITHLDAFILRKFNGVRMEKSEFTKAIVPYQPAI